MANNLDILDGAGASKTVKTTDNAGVHTPHHNVDAVIPGAGATNLGKAEDAAHTDGDTGVMLLAVRKDTAAALAGTDGDYIPLIVGSDGGLYVRLSQALPAGTNAIGKLAANDGVDIGDVTATNLPATVDTNSGNKSASTLRIVMATDQPTMTNAQPVQLTAAGTLTDRSGTITAGGTRQQLAAANSARRYLFVQNQSTGYLYIRFTSTATQDQSSMRLDPGGSWESPSGFCPTQACDIVGATTGQAFHAVEG